MGEAAAGVVEAALKAGTKVCDNLNSKLRESCVMATLMHACSEVDGFCLCY